MSDVLAYDPTRLVYLRRSLRWLLESAGAVRCDEVLAAGAMRSVRRLLDDTEQRWLPLAERVARSHPLDRPAELLDPATASWLADDLATGTDLGWRTSHVLDHWRTWAPALAATRSQIGSDDPEAGWLPAIDDTLAEFGQVVAAREGSAAALDDVDAFTAALMLPGFGLAGQALADAAAAILRRWEHQTPPTDLTWQPDDRFPFVTTRTPDLLALTLLCDAQASRAFAHLVADDPSLILADGVVDTGRTGMVSVIARGTDPSIVGAAEAGSILVPLIEAMHATNEPGRAFDAWHPMLADILTPWLVQCSPRVTDWGISADRKEAIVQFVEHDGDLLARLVDDAGAVVGGLQRWIAVDSPSAEQLAAVAGSLAQMVEIDKMKDSATRIKGWKLLWGIVGAAVGAAPLSLGLGIVATGVIWVAASATDDHGAATANAKHAALWREDLVMTAMAASVAHDLVMQWKADGTLPKDFFMPPHADPHSDMPSVDYIGGFETWRDSLPGGYGSPLANKMTLAVFTILNPWTAGVESVRLANSTE